jgi:hypothetical protein
MPRGFRERRSGIRTIWGGLGTVKAFFAKGGEFHEMLPQPFDFIFLQTLLSQLSVCILKKTF